MFKDFATDDGGDNLVELLAQARRLPFKEALRECDEWLGPSVTASSRTTAIPRRESLRRVYRFPSDVYTPTDQECRDVQQMVETLVSDSSLWERIAKGRGWKPETIRQLALETYLGWRDSKLAFIYDTGIKLRWRCKGERIIRWAFGKPWLWRGAYLSIPTRTNVYITEGEPDCIALLDGGLEDDETRLAVALPSSSTFDSSWARLFTGKHVVLCFDADDAGQKAVARVSSLLQGYAGSVRRLDWEGLRHAC